MKMKNIGGPSAHVSSGSLKMSGPESGLSARVQAELANHAVEITSQRSEVLEGFDSLLGALSILRRQLRNMSGGFGYFAGGRCLLSGCRSDKVNLLFDLRGRLDDGFEAFAGICRFSHASFIGTMTVLHYL